ncbi:hypothetical protein L7F22_068392 [Adiantum nelumboides]|nr:hypothetical protein [Adiantum nelumboides]
MSNDKQILVVFGATGLQGSSVVNSVLESSFLSSKYSIRAVTRDVNKESSKALAARGCEVVQADVDNLDQVKKAVRGAFGVFALTNYWDDLSDNSKEKEIRQGKNLIDASKAEGVKVSVQKADGLKVELTRNAYQSHCYIT